MEITISIHLADHIKINKIFNIKYRKRVPLIKYWINFIVIHIHKNVMNYPGSTCVTFDSECNFKAESTTADFYYFCMYMYR